MTHSVWLQQQAVQGALDKMLASMKGCVLSIAHRLTTIRNCDLIVVIHEGTLAVSHNASLTATTKHRACANRAPPSPL